MSDSPPHTITALEPQARRPDRYNLYLDGRFALGLDEATVVSGGLHVGGELTASELEALTVASTEGKLLDAALRFLAPRPRSRAEVRRRLLAPRPHREPPDRDAVEHVLDRLEALDLIDDQNFAQFWVENRERFSPRSARALGQELRQHGVAKETVEAVSQPERDEARAVEAGRQRLRSLAGVDYETFRARLGQFLQRRGFSYAVARDAVRVLWQEAGGGRDEDAADADEF